MLLNFLLPTMVSNTLVLTFLLLPIAVTRSTMHMKITKIECSSKPKYFINHSCYLKAVNRFKSTVFVELVPRINFYNISMNMAVLIRNDVNYYRPGIVNVTSNVCRYFDKSNKGNYFSGIIMRLLKKYSNFNHSCPLTGPLLIRDLYFDVTTLPFNIPTRSYKVILNFYEGYPMEHGVTVAAFMDLVADKEN